MKSCLLLLISCVLSFGHSNEIVGALGACSRAIKIAMFTPDSQGIFVVDDCAAANTWNVPTKQLQSSHSYKLEISSGQVNGAAFLPDSTMIFVWGENAAHLLDMQTGQILQTFEHPLLPANYWVQDWPSELVLGRGTEGFTLWKLRTGQQIQTPRAMMNAYNGIDGNVVIAYSPEGNKVLIARQTGHKNRIELWNIFTGDLLLTLENPDRVDSITYSPDGTTFITGDAVGNVKLWSTATGRLIHTMAHGEIQIPMDRTIGPNLMYSPNGEFILSYFSTGRLWSAKTGQLLLTFDIAKTAAFASDSKTVLIGDYNTVRLWNLSTMTAVETWQESEAGIETVAYSPDNTKVLIGYTNGAIELWALPQENSLKQQPSLLDALFLSTSYK